jgi:hypothetical protein
MPIINDASIPAPEGIRMMEISLLYSFMSMMSNNVLVNMLTSTIPVLIAPSRITELKPTILKNIIAVSENSKEWYDKMNIDFIHDEDDDENDDEEDNDEKVGIEKRFEEAKERARKHIRDIEASMVPIVDPSTEEGKSFLREHSTPISASTTEDEITEKDKEFLKEHAPEKSTNTNSLKFEEVFEIYFSDLNEKAQKRLLDFVGISSPSEANWDMDIIPIAIFEKDADDDSDDCFLYTMPTKSTIANEEHDK